jgi:hypothetical protein
MILAIIGISLIVILGLRATALQQVFAAHHSSDPVCHQAWNLLQCCWTEWDDDKNGAPTNIQSFCSTEPCHEGGLYGCFPDEGKVPGGNTNTPTNGQPPTNVQPPSAPPPLSSVAPSQPPASSEQPTTSTCPDGSTPDANGNCPNTTIQQQAPQGGTETSNNNNPSDHHHHKGTNLLGGESTTPTTKKDKNNNDNNNPPAVP